MKIGKKKFVNTKLICPICNNMTSIYRKVNKQKKFGHRKWLYCWKCKKITNHFEIRDDEIEKEEDYE